jgi:hypothetical protein
MAGLAGSGLALAVRSGAATAQDGADARATHPIVGAWMSVNPGAPPTLSPVIFSADGTFLVAYPPNYLDPALGVVFQGPAVGVWEPAGVRSVRLSFVQSLSDASGAYIGTFALDGGAPEVSEDGESYVDLGATAKFTLRDAANQVIMEIGGGQGEAPATPPVRGNRIRLGDPGVPPATPAAATPAG